MPRDDDTPRDRDDSEDRPRPRESGGSGMVIAMILGGIFLVLVVCGGGLALLLIPAVQKVREAAARAQDQNNMKLIALGIHEQHDRQMSMSALGRDSNGKLAPGLSWRVSILPYIEQDSLHRSFDFTTAWDSPRNQSAANTTIPPYRTPYDGGPGTSTPYRVFVGGGAVFDPDGKPISMTAITDGTANTILFVHATDQVPWAQPKELPYSPTGPLPSFGHKTQTTGANVAMADGSVRFITKSASETSIRAAITRAQGETTLLDW